VARRISDRVYRARASVLQSHCTSLSLRHRPARRSFDHHSHSSPHIRALHTPTHWHHRYTSPYVPHNDQLGRTHFPRNALSPQCIVGTYRCTHPGVHLMPLCSDVVLRSPGSGRNSVFIPSSLSDGQKLNGELAEWPLLSKLLSSSIIALTIGLSQ